MSHVLDTHLASRQIYLHSESAHSLHSGGGEHLFEFENGIKVPGNMHLLVSMVEASIPNTQYTINSNNDTIIIDSTTHNITHGFYNVSTLTEHLTNLIPNITASYSKTSGKFTFTRSSGTFSIGAGSSSYKVIGFNPLGQSSSGTTLVCENIANLTGLTDCFVQILGLHNENSKQHTIGRVAINVPFGFYTKTSSTYKFAISNRYVQHYHVRMLDQNHNIVDFNNIPYSLVIQLDFIYNKEVKHHPDMSKRLEEAKNESD